MLRPGHVGMTMAGRFDSTWPSDVLRLVPPGTGSVPLGAGRDKGGTQPRLPKLRRPSPAAEDGYATVTRRVIRMAVGFGGCAAAGSPAGKGKRGSTAAPQR